MIDVKKTITSSIKDRIDKLRKLGENNVNAFKKILYLIVLDDVYDWSGYLDAPQKVQRKLKEARIQFILNNPELIMEREPEVYENALGESIIIKHRQPYVNVNTPQTNDTWKRVWDNLGGAGNILDVDIPQTTPTPPTSWELDPSCKIEMVYYQNIVDANTGKTLDGPPNNIVISRLTVCEKMNIYVNRATKEAYILNNETGEWEQLSGSEGMSSSEVRTLVESMRQGITNKFENGVVTHELTDTNGSTETAGLSVASTEELEDLL